MKSSHDELNQLNYGKNARIHNKLGLDSTLYLAYRDILYILSKHLFSKINKDNYRVLDFGCGAGLSTELISKTIAGAGLHAEIYGVDINEQNINFARERLPGANFIKVDLDSSLSDLGAFDLIVCNFVLVENRQSVMLNILKNITSLLGEFGIAIITNCAGKTYNRSNKWYTLNNDFVENGPDVVKDGELKFKEDQQVKLQVFASYNSSDNFTFFDFFHSGKAYRDTYQAAGLDLLETHKPIGLPSDGIEWKAEAHYSPYKIHVVKRNSDVKMDNKINLEL